MAGIVPWGQPGPQLPQLIAEAPRRPRPPEIRRTSHGLHLALVIVFGILTFWLLFAGAFMWLIVWFIVAMVNDNANHRERRDYNRAMETYPARMLAWQLRCKAEIGWVPQLPE